MRRVMWFAYRILVRFLMRLFRGHSEVIPKLSLPKVLESEKKWIWFHGASAGEWESLFPVVERALRDGVPCIATCFSPSGEFQLKRLLRRSSELRVERDSLVVGLCPDEGQWEAYFRSVKVEAFLTVKYEAWPELWHSLGVCRVPLFLLGAQRRPSLIYLARWFGFFKWSFPESYFGVSSGSDSQSLLELFPSARVEILGDPRWDRVQQRAQNSSPRVELFRQYVGSARFSEVGVLGSVWMKDLEVLGPALGQKTKLKKDCILFFVPHTLALDEMRSIEEELRHQGIAYQKTSSIETLEKINASRPQVLLVDEMGFLLELYSLATWAYVGGGFGKGVHSTLEPAFFAIPVSCGPERVDVFPETLQLRRLGQLEVIQKESQFALWVEDPHQDILRSKTEQWQTQVVQQLGSTERVWSWVVKNSSVLLQSPASVR